MEFGLEASYTTKWFRVTDYNREQVLPPKLSIVGHEVKFDVKASATKNPQAGYIKLEVARNVVEEGKEDRPGTWAEHDDEMEPEIDKKYTIDDSHLPRA